MGVGERRLGECEVEGGRKGGRRAESGNEVGREKGGREGGRKEGRADGRRDGGGGGEGCLVWWVRAGVSILIYRYYLPSIWYHTWIGPIQAALLRGAALSPAPLAALLSAHTPRRGASGESPSPPVLAPRRGPREPEGPPSPADGPLIRGRCAAPAGHGHIDKRL